MSDLDDCVLCCFCIELGLWCVSDCNEFYVDYQLCVDVCSGCIVGVEVFICWNLVDFGCMMFGQFIQDVEEIGLIVEIDCWILCVVCDQFVCWCCIGLLDLCMLINFLGQVFSLGQLSVMVCGVLLISGLLGNVVELEMIEGILICDDLLLYVLLIELCVMGVLLVLDDFGIGYLLLLYLYCFLIDMLKIDCLFV